MKQQVSDIIYNTVVIGGGVAGLAAAYQLRKDDRRVLVIDYGRDIFKRERNNPYDVANGVGGAGLYSDGKVSFFPSATELWVLDGVLLRKAYMLFQKLFRVFHIQTEDYPNIKQRERVSKGEESTNKYYKSIVLSLEERLHMIYYLALNIGEENILSNTTITGINKKDGCYHLVLNKNGDAEMVMAESIILAGGKHSFEYFKQIATDISIGKVFEKFEIGIRVECSNTDFDYFDAEQTDVKIIEGNGDGGLRTFCCCRDGIVVENSSYSYTSYNGSSGEVKNTGRSNIGIIASVPQKLAEQIKARYQDNEGKQLPGKLSDFMQEKKELYSVEIDMAIRDFLRQHFPKMSASDATMYYPVYERYGEYPELSTSLRLCDEQIWVVGDATGIFRGIMPAFISGFLAAKASAMIVNDTELLDKLHIKPSPTKPCKTVFTAQSKQTFYCRDAVCQFVFEQGAIPINPFRVFDYFLGERVDRNMVRNGNNEMIRRCDELWVFGHVSDGVLFEIATCRQSGKKVRYFTISAKIEEIREISPDDVVFEPEVHNWRVKRDDLLKLLRYGNSSAENSAKQLSLFGQDES